MAKWVIKSNEKRARSDNHMGGQCAPLQVCQSILLRSKYDTSTVLRLFLRWKLGVIETTAAGLPERRREDVEDRHKGQVGALGNPSSLPLISGPSSDIPIRGYLLVSTGSVEG